VEVIVILQLSPGQAGDLVNNAIFTCVPCTINGPHFAPNYMLVWLGPSHCPNLTTAPACCAEPLQPTLTNCRMSKISLHGSLLNLRAGLILPLFWPFCIGYRSGSESFIKLQQLPTKLVAQNRHHICRASYRTMSRAKLFVLVPGT